MKRLFRGSVVLAASVSLWSCGGDPTDAFRNGVAIIDVQPSALFVTNGDPAPKSVIVQALDEQGNPLDEPITITAGPGLTVVEDTAFLRTSRTGGSLLGYQRRFVITPTQLVSTSFTVSAGGETKDVPVRVIPGTTDTPVATVASTGPNASDTTTLTVPAPFQFADGTGVTFTVGLDTLNAVVVDRSADGRTLKILPPPGAAGTGAVTLAVDYLPSASLASATDVPLTINATVPAMAGTDAPATAPIITIPPAGARGGFIDNGSWGAAVCGPANSGAPCQLYKFTLAADATFDVSGEWSNTADIGFYFISEDGLTDTDMACDDHGNLTDPAGYLEHCTITLVAGTYLLGVVSYGPFYTPPDANPTWVAVQFATPAAAAP